MRYTITKEFRFDAAHWLPCVEKGHKCGKIARAQLLADGGGRR